jgi:hypothetical protein
MYVLIFILIWNYVLGPVILFFFKASITITLPGDVWTLLQIGLGGYVVGRSAGNGTSGYTIKEGEHKGTVLGHIKRDKKVIE